MKFPHPLQHLPIAGLEINLEKSAFFVPKIEYLVFFFKTKEGIKPVPNKVRVVLNLLSPSTMKQLGTSLRLIQLYRDKWQRRSNILAPLVDLFGECKKN